MARHVNRLSARFVTTTTTPGRHTDGQGLYLLVEASGAKRWLFLFRWQGKLKEMGLGGLASVSLADARAKAAEARRAIAAGRNPINERRAAKAAAGQADSFGPFTDALLDDIGPGFRNAKHRAQWKSTLTTYAGSLRHKRLDQIDTHDVLAVLQPIWQAKPETASRVRGRIERVLDAAKAKGLRSGENPARWRGHLELLLPKPKKLARGHHAALPYTDLPAFMVDLRLREGMAALALEFTILTAARSGEVYGAKRSEVNCKEKLWTVPATRMKAGKEHRVPLCDRALAILNAAEALFPSGTEPDDYIFPGQRRDRPLSGMAMAMLLRRMGRDAITVHGFRSTFRDWAGNETSVAREVAEAALAHAVGDKAEQAYRRDDALEKRRTLMRAWANHCEGAKPALNIVPLARSA